MIIVGPPGHDEQRDTFHHGGPPAPAGYSTLIAIALV